jgi:hypothetical protein
MHVDIMNTLTVVRQLLTIEEITDALRKLKGTDIVTVPLKQKMGTISHFIIVSGRNLVLLCNLNHFHIPGESRRHLKTMASSLVTAVRQQLYAGQCWC